MTTSDRRIEPCAKQRATPRSQAGVSMPLLVSAWALLPRLAPAALAPAADEASTFFAEGLLIALAVLGIAAVGVTAVARWSRKQDHIKEMVSFCMRYLIDVHREAEGREAATALGRAKDPRAILVLVDVVTDEQAKETVRKAAADALDTMAGGSRKYKQLINQLKSAGDQQDHPRLIELLIENFEKRGNKHVQTAYVVGRSYMRQGHYADAKEWFRIAELRNRRTPFYGNQIKRLIIDCDQRLFAKGDELFKSGKYYEAKERYSAASHGLSEAESTRYSVFLRLACAYCKLGDYEDADQAVLQALKYGQETDMSLSLTKLLQQVRDQENPKPAQLRQRVVQDIDDLANGIMAKLHAQETNTPGKAALPDAG